MYWLLTRAFADQLKQLMCFAVHTAVWDRCRFISICRISFCMLLLCCLVRCSRRHACLLLFLLRLSTWTAVSLLRKFTQLDLLPLPSLQAAQGQEATPATAVQLQTRAAILQGAWREEPRFKTVSAPMEKSIFSHKTRRGMAGNHSLNERVSVLS